MPVFFDANLGEEVELPDGLDPARQQQAMQRLYQQKQQQSQGTVLGFLGQTLAQAAQPRRQTYATISPAAAYAMTPQTFNAVLQSRQGVLDQLAQQDWASREKAAERQQQNAIQMKQDEMEQKRLMQQERYYGNSLKLQKMRYDNEQKRQAFQDRLEEDRRKREEAKAQQEEEQGKVVGGQNIVWNPETKTWIARPIAGYVDPVAARGGGSSSGRRGRGKGGKDDGEEVTAIPGWSRGVIAADGTQGWVNAETKQVMSDDAYAQQLAVANAWEKVYDPRVGHVYENRITGERRQPGGDAAGGSASKAGVGSSRSSSKEPQTAAEWVLENFKPIPGGTEEDDAAELQRLKKTAATLFPETQSAIPPMPQVVTRDAPSASTRTPGKSYAADGTEVPEGTPGSAKYLEDGTWGAPVPKPRRTRGGR